MSGSPKLYTERYSKSNGNPMLVNCHPTIVQPSSIEMLACEQNHEVAYGAIINGKASIHAILPRYVQSPPPQTREAVSNIAKRPAEPYSPCKLAYEQIHGVAYRAFSQG